VSQGKYFGGLALLLALLLFSACGSQTPAPERELVLANPSGPTVIPAIALAKDQIAEDAPTAVVYWKNNDELLALLAQEAADFAVIPISTAANLYAQSRDIVLLGVHEWKAFYLIAAAEAEFSDLSSLTGQTVYLPVGRGSTVDVLLRASLLSAGLAPDEDLSLVYAPPADIVALFQEGAVKYAALPEPFVTAATLRQGRVALDFQTHWRDLTGGAERLPIAGLFVRRGFGEAYPELTEQVARQFAASVQWSADNVAAAVELAGADLNIAPQIIEPALERIDFYYVPIAECRDEVETFLRQTGEFYPEALPVLPDDGFYRP
jgi:NitT/TauT family transport system substrate-binding protein